MANNFSLRDEAVGSTHRASSSDAHPRGARRINRGGRSSQLTIANDVDDFAFEETPINEAPRSRSRRRRLHRGDRNVALVDSLSSI
jgi:hypothetical protein